MKGTEIYDEEEAGKKLNQLKKQNKVTKPKPVIFDEAELNDDRWRKHKGYNELVKN